MSRALYDELTALPLLGPGLERARALERSLADALLREPNPALELGLLVRRGERQLAEGDDTAAETLAEAARWAMAHQDMTLELRCRLLTARALAEAGAQLDARALLRRAADESAALPALWLDRALARAAVGGEGLGEELRRAWALAEAPELRVSRAHDRLALAVYLSEASAAEAWSEAERWSLRARQLAAEHGEPAKVHRLQLQLAALLFRHGRPLDAIPALEAALLADDSRVRLSAGLLLCGLLLERGEAARAEALAEAGIALAESRRNWLVFSSMAIDRARATELQGRDPEPGLREALRRCRAEGEPGALLQARLLELAEPPAPDEPEEVLEEDPS